MKKLLLNTVMSMILVACASHHVKNTSNHLDFSKEQGVVKNFQLNQQTIRYRAFENIVYVGKPIDSHYQTMNIYIPEAYFEGGSIDGFNASTAPIFFPNNIGGYMPAQAAKLEFDKRNGNQPNAIMLALSKGYVVASSGARGRTANTGKAPAAIVDLKAAIRYLKANDGVMAGDANKIISNGTSAGGALSALLGATGNNQDYEPYLKQLEAAQASDNIFAVSAYCPISNLENADAAYEWQFNGVNKYQKIQMGQLDFHAERKLIEGQLDAQQMQVSDQLFPLFPKYVNSLNLKDEEGRPLLLDNKGNGNFKQYVAKYLLQSAQNQLDKGKNLNDVPWVKVQNGKAIEINFNDYVHAIGRQKTPPAFDALDLSSGENQLFGNESADKQHFTDFSMQHNRAENAQLAEKHIVKMMNPMNYLSTADIPKYWRIRHGSNDRDTSLAIAVILAVKLKNLNKQVDFAVPWGQGHGGDYDLEDLFAWMKNISTQS